MKSFAIFVLFFATGCLSKVENGYRGYKTYRLNPETPKQMEFLSHLNGLLESQELTDEVDFWTNPGKASLENKDPILVMIAPEKQAEVLLMFDLEGIKYQVTIPDLATAIEAESYVTPETARNDEMTWTAYHRYATIEAYVIGLAQKYPNIVKIKVIGQTYEGRKMYLLTIGKPRADGKTKPAIWMDSHIHAREWITSATLTFMINRMVTEYGTNSTATKMLNEIDWYVLPVDNPDGYEFTHLSNNNRMWRRTRRVNPFSECLGADPNRNYDHKWMYSGAVQNPCSDTYAGAFPFSEVENLHLTEAALEFKGQIKAFLTIHSAAQVWLAPWGYDYAYPDDFSDLVALGNRAAAALRSQYGTVYRVGSSTDLLGAAAGATDDWGKAKAYAKYSYTVELRDKGTYGFLLPPNQIIPSGRETFEAVVEVFKTVSSEFGPTLN